MADNTQGNNRGLIESLGVLASTLLAMVHTRLELLSSDLEEDRQRVLSLLILVLGALFCLGIGVVLAVFLLVVVFWDSNRLLVLSLLTGFFLITGLAIWQFAMFKMRTQPKLFAASLSELSKDRDQLNSRS